LSSEWENSPFIYTEISILPAFVLIGLPAQESENPLLLSLAGHELGHSVWKANNIESQYMTQVLDKIIHEIKTTYWDRYKEIYPQVKKETLTDLFARSTWMPVYRFAIRQMEEIFCDLIGLRIFAESYLYAIGYLLAPCLSGPRSYHYPNTKRRISHLEEGVRKFKVNIPREFLDIFEDNDEPSESTIKLLVELADVTSASLVPKLIEAVEHITDEKNVPERSNEEVEKFINSCFENLVPISNAKTISDILNAAWLCSHNERMWKKNPAIKAEDRSRLLNDLVLKSIEVFEIEKRMS